MKKHSTAKKDQKALTKTKSTIRHMAGKSRLTIGLDLGDHTSRYCILEEAGEVVSEGQMPTTPAGLKAMFGKMPSSRVALEVGTHSPWVSRQIVALGHEVIVANVSELRAISHSDRKSDPVDAEKLARYARLDPKIPSDCPSYGRSAGSTDVDPRPQPDRSSADSGSERSARIGQALRLSSACLVHALLREAMRGRAPAESRSSSIHLFRYGPRSSLHWLIEHSHWSTSIYPPSMGGLLRTVSQTASSIFSTAVCSSWGHVRHSPLWKRRNTLSGLGVPFFQSEAFRRRSNILGRKCLKSSNPQTKRASLAYSPRCFHPSFRSGSACSRALASEA